MSLTLFYIKVAIKVIVHLHKPSSDVNGKIERMVNEIKTVSDCSLMAMKVI